MSVFKQSLRIKRIHYNQIITEVNGEEFATYEEGIDSCKSIFLDIPSSTCQVNFKENSPEFISGVGSVIVFNILEAFTYA